MARKTRWCTHVTLEDGRRVYVSAATKKERDAKVAEIRRDAEAGVDVSDHSTLGAYALLWLDVYKRPRVKARTYNQSKGYIESHIIPGLGNMELKKVRQMHVRAFLAGLTCGETVKIKVESLLRAIFRAAVENGLLAHSPMPEAMISAPHETPEKEPLSNGEAVRLLVSVKGEPLTYRFCLLGLSCGLRRGEILGLRWRYVDLDARVIHVRRSRVWGSDQVIVDSDDTKTVSGQRDIPITAALERELRFIRESEPDEDFVIPGGHPDGGCTAADFHSLWRNVERRQVSEGRPLGKQFRACTNNGRRHPAYTVDLDFTVTPHILRHTWITQLFEAGLDIKQVQTLAGHASPEITLEIYTHYRARDRQEDTETKLAAAVSYLATGTDGKVVPFPGGRQNG